MRRIHYLLLGLLVSLCIAAVSPSLPPTRIAPGTGVTVVTNGVNSFTLSTSGGSGILTSNGFGTNVSIYSSGTTNRPLRVFGTNGTTELYVDKDGQFVTSTNIAFGGLTSASPALKRSGAELHTRLADDSDYASLRVENLYIDAELRTDNSQIYVRMGGSTAMILGAYDVMFMLRPLCFSALHQNYATTAIAYESDGVLGQLNDYAGAASIAQEYRIYGTRSASGANYVRSSLAATSTNITLAAQSGGTNSANIDVIVTPAGTGKVGIGTTTPTSTLHVNGSVTYSYVAKTANYTLTASDYCVNCTSGTFTVTLPTAVGIAGRVYVVKNSGAGVITLDGNGAETIDGAATATAAAAASITVMSDGANWIII